MGLGSLFKKFFRPRRECSHGQMIGRMIAAHREGFPRHPVFVETGCGLSTLALAEAGRPLGANVFSCDYNGEKVEELRRRAAGQLEEVQFLIGDSLESLRTILKDHPAIHFLYLDSAASALHTFREFLLAEEALKTGACLLMDNAALPGQRRLLSPVRKGKILVPYLLASPFWDVSGHPRSGDSMVFALRHEDPHYSDPAYELPEKKDHWRSRLEKNLPPP
jgi:predicted O-methyltransferase YrrM